MTTILKGNIVSAPACGRLDVTEHGYLIAENGVITGVYPVLPEQYAGASVEDYGDCLIVQSFADLHLHAPQYPMLGMGMDLPLLDWLNAYAFPTEARFAEPDYARTVYRQLAGELASHGTTRVCMFSSLHTDATLILMDELEKAHPDVMNILLQILDEGKINDAQGRTVDFSNTVICMTSNAGSSDQSTSSLGFNKSEEQRSAEKTRKALAQFLRPEFLGRVDEVITFKPLSEETLQGIAALMLDEYKPGMDAKGIAYRYTPAALKALVKKSEGGKFGARDLRRVIRKAVEDPAAEKLIDGTLASGSTLVVDADENGEIVLN